MATKKTQRKSRSQPSQARSHLPALNQARLTLTLQQLKDEPVIPVEAKRAITDSLQAATNPNAESPSVVIASLDKADQDAVRTAQTFYAQTMGRMNRRGRAALMQMSDAEFEARLGQTDEGGNGD
jgi:hypothetical protein